MSVEYKMHVYSSIRANCITRIQIARYRLAMHRNPGDHLTAGKFPCSKQCNRLENNLNFMYNRSTYITDAMAEELYPVLHGLILDLNDMFFAMPNATVRSKMDNYDVAIMIAAKRLK